MTARKSPGRKLRELLDRQLGDGCSWTEADLVVLDKLAKAEDRAAELEELFAAELAKDEPNPQRVAQVGCELRQHEQTITRWASGLVFNAPEEGEQPKSPQHQRAARARWEKRTARGA